MSLPTRFLPATPSANRKGSHTEALPAGPASHVGHCTCCNGLLSAFSSPSFTKRPAALEMTFFRSPFPKVHAFHIEVLNLREVEGFMKWLVACLVRALAFKC